MRSAKEDLNKLFIHKNVTEEVIRLQKKIPENLKSFFSVLKQDKVEPDIDIVIKFAISHMFVLVKIIAGRSKEVSLNIPFLISSSYQKYRFS